MLGKNFHMLVTLALVVVCTFYLRQPHETEFLPGHNQVHQPVQRNLDASADILVATLCQNFQQGVFTQAQQDSATQCKDSLQSFRSGNPMLDIVEEQSAEPDTEDDDAAIANRDAAAKQYGKTLLKIEIFLGIFFFFTFVCYWGFFLNFFAFGKSICFCFNWGDNTNVKVKWAYGLFTLMFVAGLVGVGIAGLGVSSGVQEVANGAICSLSFSFQDLVNGKPDENWLGLNKTSAGLNALLTNLTVLQNDTDLLSVSVDAWESNYTTINNSITASYNNHQNDQLTRPDNQSTPLLYVPKHISAYGPQTQEGQTLYYIQSAVDQNGANVNDTFRQLTQGISSIGDETDMWQTIDQGRNVTEAAAIAAETLMSLSNSYSQQVNDTTSEAESILHTIFQSLCLIPIFCIFWWFLTYILKARIFVCLSLGWILLSLLALTGWIISLILIPSNITLMETCGVIEEALADGATFNKTINLFSTKADSVNKYLYTCIHGTGADATIPALLGMDKALASFKQNYNSSYDAIEQIAARPLVSTTFSSADFDSHMTDMQNYRTYVAVDNDIINTDITTVNQYSNKPNSQCEPMQDTWYFNSNQCVTTDGTLYPSNETDYYNVGHQTCIGINVWVEGASVVGKYIEDRYAVLRYLKDCQDNDNATDIVNANRTETIIEGFTRNRVQLNSSIDNITQDLSDIQQQYTNYIQSVNALPSLAVSMNTSMIDLYSTLYDNKTGLMNNLDCKIIKTSLDQFSTNMCVGLIPTIFQLSLLTTLMALFASFGACTMFCFARRMRSYGLGEEIIDEKKVKLNEPKPQEVQMATRVY